jgi:hypothetical protein
MKRSELAYLQDTDNADMMSPDDMMDYTTEFDMMDRGEETEEQAAARKAEAGKLVGGLTSAIADITPFVGSAKAATELPEDVALVEELIAAGYEEGDIKKMGLGGTMAVLTGLGFLPGAKLAADVGKRAIKEGVEEAADELGTQTRRAFGQEALISPQRQAQLDAAAQLPASERRKFLKEVNRPDQLVFHGAPSMLDSPDFEQFEYKVFDAKRNNIYDRLQSVDNQVMSKLESSLSGGYGKDQIDDYVSKTEFAGINIPVFKDAEGQYDTIPVRLRKGEDGGIDIVRYDDETMEDVEVIDNLPAEYVELLTQYPDPVEELSKDLRSRFSQISDARSTVRKEDFKTRKESILESGFQRYGDLDDPEAFKGARGMAGRATGAHHEFRFPALSTSVDPGVAMKPLFAGMDPEKIVYSRLPKDRVRELTPDEYDRMATRSNQVSRSERLAVAPLSDKEIGYRLPKSIHLEDEIAVTKPEELEPKALTDNPELLGLVKEQQEKVDNLLLKIDGFNRKGEVSTRRGDDTIVLDTDKFGKGVPIYKITTGDKEAQQEAYKQVRTLLNEMQSLGKYSRGQGTGDTYDNMMDNLFFNDSGDETPFLQTVEALATHLPKDSQRQKLVNGIGMIGGLMRGKDFLTAAETADNQLRNVSDKVLRDIFFRGKIPEGISPETANQILQAKPSRADIKRLMFLATENMNRGGLMTRK